MTTATPSIVLHDLAARGGQGTIFSSVSVRANRGEIVVITGPANSGRTALLLAIAGRFHASAGTVAIEGHDDAAEIRRLVAVARAGRQIDLDDELRVRDVYRERMALGRPRVVLDSLLTAIAVLQLHAPPQALVADLHPADRLLLATAVVVAEAPYVIAIDDVDAGLLPADRRRVWAALRRLASTDVTIVGTATTPPGDDIAAQVVELPHRPVVAESAESAESQALAS